MEDPLLVLCLQPEQILGGEQISAALLVDLTVFVLADAYEVLGEMAKVFVEILKPAG